ncbi:DUF302 domain-containing protein [Arcobacter sp. F2176]|uniref:DUF302 domain-containing protein n=1 Tax=Arcobacter sp. F2176 TaxID=2044511 RepID=UPI00100C0364|nr:DUF302 domain-containing protein [Arcobacter sp. F2176]RXJ82315.1 hypothetical protein CRU95_02330 [Arcobacter sp. F2176]
MYKQLFIILMFSINLHASFTVYEDKNLFTIKLENKKFEDLLINLKSELSYQGYVIIHELDLAKSINTLAKALKKSIPLEKGKNLLICKRSFALKMIEENIHNITFCPLSISIYKKDTYLYISYKKFHSFEKANNISIIINNKLKDLILRSLDN